MPTPNPSPDRHAGTTAFWEDPETVAWFAARPPDARVMAAFRGRHPATRVLDLGCAAGRNALWLAHAGFDVHALDASAAMVACTRARLAPVVGRAGAEARVRRGDMTDLGAYADGNFEVVLAIGLLPGARGERDWQRAVAEMARVLVDGGELLLTHFTPDAPDGGPPLRGVPGEPHLVRHAFDERPAYLLGRAELDAQLAAHGLRPVTPTHAVAATTMGGRRVTLNGHFRKRAAQGAAYEEPS